MNLKRLKTLIKTRLLSCSPRQAVVEPTNYCNLNCPFCMVGMQNELLQKYGNTAHNLMTRPMGFMSQHTFDRIMGELMSFGIRKVYLHFQGEPFLNKLTPRFALQLKENNFEVGIFTNGQVFNVENLTELAKAQVDLIRFSVDGASEETYQQNRVGGQFSTVFENMKKVISAHKGKKTRFEWQYLALKNNEHEIEKARQMAKEIGVYFFVKGFRQTDLEMVPDNPKYRAQFHKKPCTDIYHQLGIYWNGDVVPCCYDVDAKEVMGNLMRRDIVSIWNSGKYKDFRKRVGKFKSDPLAEPSICKNCLRWR